MRGIYLTLMALGVVLAIFRGSHRRQTESELPADIENQIIEVAKQQGEAAKNAKVTIHRAYGYSGPTYMKPEANEKLVGIDVEIVGRGEGLDLDDIEILNGETNEGYGDSPQIALLNRDGTIQPDESKWPESSEPLRVLLVYAVPKSVSTVKLHYWGAELTPVAAKIAGAGPSLPARRNQK